MKRIKLFLMLLVAAMLLPTGAWAQETHVITSTFTGFADVDNEESWSCGTLVSTEGNNWSYSGAGNPNYPSCKMEGGSFALYLKNKAFGFSNLFDMTGFLKKVTIKAGGSLSEIHVYTYGGEKNVMTEVKTITPTSASLTTYEIIPEGDIYVDSENNLLLHVALTPDKDKDYFASTYLESIEVEYVEGAAPDEHIVSTFTEWKKDNLPSSEAIYGYLLSEESVENPNVHNWYVTIADANATVAPTTLNQIDGTIDKCVLFTIPNAGFLNLCYDGLNGIIKKVIVKSIGNYTGIKCTASDRTTYANQSIQKTVTLNDSKFMREDVFEFNSFKSANGQVDVEFTGATNVYLQRITIVMETEGSGEEPLSGLSGTTGDLKWKAEETGKIVVWDENGNEVEKPKYRLTISGSGLMANSYNSDSPAPWAELTTITEVIVEDGAYNIGRYAFTRLEHLTKVTLPSGGLKWIGDYAFSDSPVAEITLPEGLESIGDNAFDGNPSLKSIHFPASLTSVKANAFMNNNLATITVAAGNTVYNSPEGSNALIRTADNELVFGCPATVIPATVTSIGDYAFYFNYSLKSIVIPEGVVNIGMRAFSWCENLAGIMIPNSVTTIGRQAFLNSSKINEIVIGSGVTTIGPSAFSGCKNVADVSCYADPAALTWEDYNNANSFMAKKATLFHVKKADLAAWQTKFPNINATFVGDLDAQGSVSDGDVDGDGEVTSDDVAMVVKVIASLVTDEKTKTAADVNGDGKIDIVDIIALVNLLLGK